MRRRDLNRGIGGLIFAPWDARGAWIRAGLLVIWCVLAGVVLSQGYRVRGAMKAAHVAIPGA